MARTRPHEPRRADPAPLARPEAGRARNGPTADWERKRRKILDVAADVFFIRGFQGGTTKEIAERAGLSQPTIYYYVGSKEDLMAEIALQVDRDFTKALDEALAQPGDLTVQLGRIIDSFVASLVLNQRTFAVYWKEYRAIPADLAKEISSDERDYVRRVEAVVAAAQHAGILPAQRPTRVVTEGLLGMLSWTHWWYKPDEFSADEVAQTFKAMLGL